MKWFESGIVKVVILMRLTGCIARTIRQTTNEGDVEDTSLSFDDLREQYLDSIWKNISTLAKTDSEKNTSIHLSQELYDNVLSSYNEIDLYIKEKHAFIAFVEGYVRILKANENVPAVLPPREYQTEKDRKFIDSFILAKEYLKDDSALGQLGDIITKMEDAARSYPNLQVLQDRLENMRDTIVTETSTAVESSDMIRAKSDKIHKMKQELGWQNQEDMNEIKTSNPNSKLPSSKNALFSGTNIKIAKKSRPRFSVQRNTIVTKTSTAVEPSDKKRAKSDKINKMKQELGWQNQENMNEIKPSNPNFKLPPSKNALFLGTNIKIAKKSRPRFSVQRNTIVTKTSTAVESSDTVRAKSDKIHKVKQEIDWQNQEDMNEIKTSNPNSKLPSSKNALFSGTNIKIAKKSRPRFSVRSGHSSKSKQPSPTQPWTTATASFKNLKKDSALVQLEDIITTMKDAARSYPNLQVLHDRLENLRNTIVTETSTAVEPSDTKRAKSDKINKMKQESRPRFSVRSGHSSKSKQPYPTQPWTTATL